MEKKGKEEERKNSNDLKNLLYIKVKNKSPHRKKKYFFVADIPKLSPSKESLILHTSSRKSHRVSGNILRVRRFVHRNEEFPRIVKALYDLI